MVADWIVIVDTGIWRSSNQDADTETREDQSLLHTHTGSDIKHSELKWLLFHVTAVEGVFFFLYHGDKWVKVINADSCCPDLKHSLRRARVSGPAWYSSPPMIDDTRSSSSTNTANSLSLLPSMLRSLMLADPGEQVEGNEKMILRWREAE